MSRLIGQKVDRKGCFQILFLIERWYQSYSCGSGLVVLFVNTVTYRDCRVARIARREKHLIARYLCAEQRGKPG
jgi:hypothetical protein